MTFRRLAEAVYLRRLRSQVGTVPRHIAVVMDGHRRWARERGLDVRKGHERGFDHVADLLDWCARAGVEYVTVFWTSVDNLRKRDSTEADALMVVIERVITSLAAPGVGWRIEAAGHLDLVPDRTAHAIKRAVEATRGIRGRTLTVAVGYDGREEITEAVRSLLDDAAHEGRSLADLVVTPEDIARNLWTRFAPDPDLVLRTSGEQRLSGFLLWQAANADLYFADVYWPSFREIDFYRALRGWSRGSTARTGPPRG